MYDAADCRTTVVPLMFTPLAIDVAFSRFAALELSARRVAFA